VGRLIHRVLVALLVLAASPGFAIAEVCQVRVFVPLSKLSTAGNPANVSAREAVARYKNRDQMMIGYFKGIADGYTWAAAAERAKGQGGRLFCEPASLDFDADMTVRVLEKYLDQVQIKPDGFDPCGSLPLVMLRAYQRAYPCKA
jgi:hypothetical protein